jgi:pimeloyl-ACP methyl ester carboxylesterase
MDHRTWPVILLPGGILPAGPAYAALLDELGSDVDARIKDLELYSTPEPPPRWSLATEADGITRLADEAGFDRFHLVGYSGGGASSLAFVARYPDRLLSLAVLEPAFAGWQGMTPAERSHFERFRGIVGLPDPEQMAAFQALQLAPGVEPAPPPSGPAPAWMAQRPAGVRALLAAFFGSDLDPDVLRRFDRPVLFVLGGRSHPDYYARMAERLANVFSDFTVETFPDRHHFDPPHRNEPERVASHLRSLWSRADGSPQPITARGEPGPRSYTRRA